MPSNPYEGMYAGSRGASLFELLTVVSLLAVMTAMAYSSLAPYRDRYRLHSAAVAVAAELGRTRQEAIRTRLCHFFVPQGATTFRIVRDSPNNPNCQVDGTDPVVRTVDLSVEFPGVRFSTAGVTQDPYGSPVYGGNPTLTFRPRGLVTGTGAAVFLATASHGPEAVTVTAAGGIRTWRYDGGWQ